MSPQLSDLISVSESCLFLSQKTKKLNRLCSDSEAISGGWRQFIESRGYNKLFII